MSTLRKRLKDPRLYLGMLCALGLLVLADSSRIPAHQLTAHWFIESVDVYHARVSPLLMGYVRCRYRPTCSRYSVEAVRKYGIAKGIVLTGARLWRCRSGVPVGTEDPLR